MTRLVLAGGSYAFALPDGTRGVLMPNALTRGPNAEPLPDPHIATSDGRVELPGELVLFLVGCRLNGQLWMAGQGHSSGRAWLHGPGGWTSVSTTHGVSPCAFGAGCLFVAVAGDRYLKFNLVTGQPNIVVLPIGSQGLRYIDESGATPRPVTGDVSYRDGELFEFTTRGTVTIGQGHDGGVHVRTLVAQQDGTPVYDWRVLGAGDEQGRWVAEGPDRRFLRFARSPQMLALAMVDQPGRAAVCYWLTTADLADLPRLTTAPTLPPPIVSPPTPPVPVPPKESTVETPDDAAIVRSCIQSHPELSNDESGAGTLTEYAALALHDHDPNWGLLSKTPGEHNYRGHAVDAVIYKDTQQVVDILQGAGDGGSLQAAWGFSPKRDQNHWMAPITPIQATTLPPTIPDAPAAPSPNTELLQALLTRLAVLERDAVRYGLRIYLTTDNGSLVSAEGGGGGDINASRPPGTNVGGWEAFRVGKA